MKKILLPTDFSFNSKNAISYALNFYKEEPCEFILLYACAMQEYEPPDVLFSRVVRNTDSKEKKDAEKNLNMLMQEIKMRFPNPKHSFRKVAVNLSLLSAIKKEVKDSSCDLIVIGTQGSTNLKEVSFGTNTVQILENISNCPILAIPSHINFSQFREIVLATGFKTVPENEEYSFIKELLIQKKATLRILYINENEGLSPAQLKNKEILFKIFEGLPYTFHSLFHVNVPIGIYCFTESRNSDMVSFINKKHRFFEKILFNPLYKNIGNYSKIPLLIIQKKEIRTSENPELFQWKKNESENIKETK
jgi:nucleotide-binding universal stress UspA family protein